MDALSKEDVLATETLKGTSELILHMPPDCQKTFATLS